jgi:hypothetical protein
MKDGEPGSPSQADQAAERAAEAARQAEDAARRAEEAARQAQRERESVEDAESPPWTEDAAMDLGGDSYEPPEP